MSNKAGRPAKYKSVEQLQKKIKEYIDNCPDKIKITSKTKDGIEEREVSRLTISGLAYYLGFADRQSFYDYEKRKNFSCTVKRARLFIEKTYESYLMESNCTGAIFALKNFGWKDRQEIDTGENLTNILSALRKTAK
jgi:hypothetical protein